LLGIEQARVLDGDDGLVGKSLEKVDLSIGERAHLGASDNNNSNGSASAD
jgi:hypothetical protein